MKQKEDKRIAKRFFESPYIEICRILIEELQKWKSTKKPSTEEFLALADRLAKIIKAK
jgi:preprotein translocase subunit Sss1